MNWKEIKVLKKLHITGIVSAFEANYSPQYAFKGENHNFWEFLYVTSGKICVVADDRVHYLKQGDIIFHRPMEYHKFSVMDGQPAGVFVVSFYLSGSGYDELYGGVFSINGEILEKMNGMIEFFRNHKENEKSRNFLFSIKNDPFLIQQAANYIEIFLIEIARYGTHSKELTTRNTITYKRIVNFMKENVCENLTIEDIAGSLGMSVSNLKKVYAMYSVFSIHKYFVKLKISKAIELLSKGCSVAEISEMLKFNNQNYFSVVFKRETNMSPLTYRRKILKKK